MSKNICKKVSGRCNYNAFDHTKKSATQSVIQKTAEGTGFLHHRITQGQLQMKQTILG